MEEFERIFTEQISKGLRYLYREKGLAHRDIKPRNILKMSNGDYKLSDLGVSKRVIDRSTGTTTLYTRRLCPLFSSHYFLVNERQLTDPVEFLLEDSFALGLSMLQTVLRLSEKDIEYFRKDLPTAVSSSFAHMVREEHQLKHRISAEIN